MITFLISILTIITFSIAYAVKGGQLVYFIPKISNLRAKNKIYDRLLDSKVLSTLIVVLYSLLFTSFNPLLVGLFWLIAVGPSMGEEHAAIMGVTNRWYSVWMPEKKSITLFGKTFEWIEGNEYGVKKALQRGVWMGAAFALLTSATVFITFSLLYVPLVYLGFYLGRKFNQDGWMIGEFLVGAVCFGIPFSLI